MEQRTFVLVIVAALTAAMAACRSTPALTQQLEARRLASEMHVEFTKASDAASRAVLADNEEMSAAAANDARRSRQIVEQNLLALQPVLQALGYTEDLRHLEEFTSRFDEYRRLDDEILPLSAENTNVKALRLSFGPAREADEAFRAALEATVRAAGGGCAAIELAGRARLAVLEIQVLQRPHIAEARDEIMTRLESEMKTFETAAREALEQLRSSAPPAAAVTTATAALDRFMAINAEIVALSRRNSNVRSLALTLGRKRTVAAECELQLQALDDALAKHAFTATR